VNYAAAFEALYDEATIPQPEGNRGGRNGDMPEYVEYGYVPDDIGGSSVSVTLEYAYADASLASLAEHVGETEKASELRERSNSWEALWYDDTKFILPRFADGSFDTEISTETSFDRSGSFAEGSAWHYRFYALHDLEDVVDKYGAELFEDTLETFFEESSLVTPTATGGLLPEPYYWHSNQPSIDAAFLFHAVDRPDRVAHWVTEVREKKYGPEADGVPGNDDGGTMSAWYVLSSIGLYPRVGTSRYWTSQPLFRAVQFDTGSDETTTLRVRDELSCCEGYGLALPEGEVVYELEHEALLGETLLFE
jgi:predicted alpha-1,2-mannosidase